MGIKNISRFAVGYIFWAISIVIAGVVGLLLRDAIMNALVVGASANMSDDAHTAFYLGFQLRAVEPWTYMLFGILMIVLVVFLETFYRTGAAIGRLLQRFMIVTGIQAVVLAAAHVIRFAASSSLGSAPSLILLLAAIELAVAAALIFFSRRLAHQPQPFDLRVFEQ